MKKIRVDRLHVRLKGIRSSVVRPAAAGIGQKILSQFAGQAGLGKANGNINIRAVDSGLIRAPRGATVSDVRNIIARTVAGAVVLDKELTKK
jgi:hypothetical protein